MQTDSLTKYEIRNGFSAVKSKTLIHFETDNPLNPQYKKYFIK